MHTKPASPQYLYHREKSSRSLFPFGKLSVSNENHLKHRTALEMLGLSPGDDVPVFNLLAAFQATFEGSKE